MRVGARGTYLCPKCQRAPRPVRLPKRTAVDSNLG
ncbi:MAG: hypothetical protein M3457_19425 [Chloroflexota bacterium]|nr:hypothetical protein [Chloroflexota bacterium]